MGLQVNIVELWDDFLGLRFQRLLDEIFSFVPFPRFIDFAVVLHDESSFLDAIFVDAPGSFTFCVNPKSLVVFLIAKLEIF